MTDKFDLRKYLIENRVTTNSKLLKEIRLEPETDTGRPGGFVIEIEWGTRGWYGNIAEYLVDTNFVTHCYKKSEQMVEDYIEDYGSLDDKLVGKPFFNAGMTACDISATAERGYIYILSSSLQEDVKAKLLDKETPENEIRYIIDSLGIEYF